MAQLVLSAPGQEPQRWPLPLPVSPTKLAALQCVELKDVELRVPLFARGGSFSVAPEVGWSRLANPAAARTVTLHAREVQPAVAEIKEHGGVPTLFINGRPHSGMSYMTYHPAAKHFAQFGRLGVHLYSFSATPTEAAYGLSKTCWVTPVSSTTRASRRA